MSRVNYDFGLYDVDQVSSLKEIVAYAAAQYGDRPAFIYQTDPAGEIMKISFRHYQQDIATVAAGLINALRIDLNRRDSKKIALIAPNSYWWSVMYLAVVNLGHVIVPLDPQLPASDLLSFCQRAGVSSLIFTSEISDKIEQMKAGLAKIKHFISLDPSPAASITLERIRNIGSKQLRKNPTLYEQVKIYPETLATLIFTSGTTSTPKAVMLTHKNIVSDVLGICQVNRLEREVLLSMLPLYHSYEFTLGLAWQIFRGSTTYYLPGGLLAFRDNLAKVRPTVLLLVPLIVEGTYQRVVAELAPTHTPEDVAASLKEYYGGRLTRIFVGGAPINNLIADEYEKCGIRILQGYGISECSPAVAMNPDKKHRHRSVGLPLPNVKVAIDQANDEGVGEILVRGPNVMLGYYKDERQTDKALVDNWLHTGDFGKFDDEGFLYVVGRQKNVIVGKNAKNVYPEEIEYALVNRPSIKEALVYGKLLADDTKVAALIVPDPTVVAKGHEQEAVAADIAAVNAATAKYKAVVDWELVAAIPRTATGKVKRQVAGNR